MLVAGAAAKRGTFAPPSERGAPGEHATMAHATAQGRACSAEARSMNGFAGIGLSSKRSRVSGGSNFLELRPQSDTQLAPVSPQSISGRIRPVNGSPSRLVEF